MTLYEGDATPTGCDFKFAYTAIYRWYTANPDGAKQRLNHTDQGSLEYAASSRELIAALPDPSSATDTERRAIFNEVTSGYLEWGHHSSDGDYKMAAYAYAALETRGLGFGLSNEEKDELRSNGLHEYLSPIYGSGD